jgi:co-chaperonin GroES (HSP10)
MVASDVNFECYADNVLLEEIKKDKSAGGILVPEGARLESTAQARVLKVGPGKYDPMGNLVPMRVQVGDVVYMLVGRVAPLAVMVDGKEYFCLPESTLIGKAAR